MKVSDTQLPKLILTEQGSTPSTPNAGDQKLFIDSSDHHLKRVDENDSVTDVESGGSGSGLYEAYICIQNQQSQNTAGGTFTSGAWRTRVLNTEVADADGLASISSNQITLEAGTYRCYARCPAFGVASHQGMLYNISDSAILLIGSSAIANGGSYPGQSDSIIAGRFTIAAQKIIEVQHRCADTKSTNGLGVASNFGTEVYTSIELWKEA